MYRGLFLAGYRPSSITILLLLALCPGCSSKSDELKRYAISGNVTFDDQPVPRGEITFMPDITRGNSGPGSSGLIESGKFEIPASRGIVGGAYRVEMNGYHAPTQVTASSENPDTGRPMFEGFQVTVEFPAQQTIHDFSVPSNIQKLSKQ